MKFYKYLENKFFILENESVNYYYDLKKFYPIIKNKFYKKIDDDPKEIDKKGALPKIIDGNYLYKTGGSSKIIKVLVKQTEPSSNNNSADYIEVNNVYYPIFTIKDKVGYIDEDGKFIIINLNEYKIKNKSINNYYIDLSNKGKSSSSSSEASLDANLASIEKSEEPSEEPSEEAPEEASEEKAN